MSEYKALSMNEQIELQQQLEQAQARNAELEQAACDLNTSIAKHSKLMTGEDGFETIAVEISDIDIHCDALEFVSNKTPAQSSAEIEARAELSGIRRFINEYWESSNLNLEQLYIKWEAKLRQQAGSE